MGLSAFNEEGLLKKHALQGTGLGAATDSASRVQQNQITALTDEASRRNLNQDQMQGILQGRAERYGSQQQYSIDQAMTRANELKEEYTSTEASIADAQRFRQHHSGSPWDSSFADEARVAWEEAGGAWGSYDRGSLRGDGGRGNYINRAFQGNLDRNISHSDARAIERGFLSNKENRGLYTMTGRDELKDFRAAGAPERGRLREGTRDAIRTTNRRHLENFTKERWETLYDWNAEKRYHENRERVKDELNKDYFPLVTESGERTALIEDRLELYNMFLGE